jgi:hypothetical protein
MDELVIRHCTMRVVRHGGWSWGGDRRALVDRMTKLAPGLIAARLAELFADQEGDIAEPVRLRIKLPARALRDDRALAETLHANLANVTALRSIASGSIRPPEPVRLCATSSPSPEASSIVAAVAPVASKSLRKLLLEWRAGGQLLSRLRGIPNATVELWIAYLTTMAPERTSAGRQIDSLVSEARAIRDRLALAIPRNDQGASMRLATLVELLARHGEALAAADMATIIDRLAGAPDAAPERRPPAARGKPSARDQPGDMPAARGTDPPTPDALLAAAPSQRSTTATEVQLTSVLPFLTLGMLARIGWLDVAAASLEAIALPDKGAVLAAALAERLVPKAGPSTREAETRQRTIACFAGLEHAPAPAAFGAWSRVASDGLGALDAFIADEIAEGHDPEMPLLVSLLSPSHGEMFVLFDGDGHYPVAVVPDLPSLLAQLDRFRASVLLVARHAATPALVAALNRREQGFVTDAPPGRNEKAQRIPSCSGLWSNAHDIPHHRIASAAEQFETLVDASEAGLERLLSESEPNALVVSAYLSAAMGLGLLSWKLWHEREQTNPLLALDRLANLEGTARITPEAVEIRPAFGRRYLDLKRHDALAEIPDVPWLGGRRIRFAGP